MNKIKILYYGLSTRQGGIETYLKKIFDNIDRNRFEIYFIKVADKVCFEDYFKEKGAKFYFIGRRSNPFYYIKMLVQLFRKEKVSIVHVNLNTLSSAELIYIALLYKCKVIVHSRSSMNAGSVLTLLLHTLNRYLLRNKNVTRIAVSDVAGKWLFGSSNIYNVYPNGVDTCKFIYNKTSRNEIRKKYSISENDVLIGHVGHLSYPKNQSFLIRLLPMLQRLNKSYKLMLVGDGCDKQRLIDYVSEIGMIDSIFFVGRQNDVEKYYSAFDIFCFPSFFEGFPNAVLEAEASGLIPIISDQLTTEVMLENRAQQIPLKESLWVDAISKCKISDKRKHAVDLIKQAKLDVTSEVERLENLYISMIK
ncbi:glycosyltransferase [Parabacteroides sp. APC149_11_2_Y6]